MNSCESRVAPTNRTPPESLYYRLKIGRFAAFVAESNKCLSGSAPLGNRPKDLA